MKLLDTTVAVDFLRGEAAAVSLLREIVGDDGDALLASELVRFELLAGVRNEERETLERFFTVPTWVPLTEEISRVGGSLAQRHRPAYSGIDDADYLIAATTIVLAADLLTTSVRHFPMLEGLRPAY